MRIYDLIFFLQIHVLTKVKNFQYLHKFATSLHIIHVGCPLGLELVVEDKSQNFTYLDIFL